MKKKLAAEITRREQDIMYLIARHYTYREMCNALGISIRTVNRHIQNIMEKTGIHRQIHLIEYAQEHGYGRKQVSA